MDNKSEIKLGSAAKNRYVFCGRTLLSSWHLEGKHKGLDPKSVWCQTAVELATNCSKQKPLACACDRKGQVEPQGRGVRASARKGAKIMPP